jgi:hypothetical protein
MNTEFAARLEQPGYIADWSKKNVYGYELSAEDKEMNAAADAFIKEIGRTGNDRDHEIAQLFTKALTPEVINAPGEILSRMFVEGTIGEFDDKRIEYNNS